jgi:hypothetical protein
MNQDEEWRAERGPCNPTAQATTLKEELEKEAALDPMSAAFFQTFGDAGGLVDTPFMHECVGDSPKANELFDPQDIIKAKGFEVVEPLPEKGYENAMAPADGAPPKASTISLRLYDGGFGQNFEVSRDFESSIRGLFAALSNAPSIDQLNALIAEREKFRTEAYQARERDAQTMLALENSEALQQKTAYRVRQLRVSRWAWLSYGVMIGGAIAAATIAAVL